MSARNARTKRDFEGEKSRAIASAVRTERVSRLAGSGRIGTGRIETGRMETVWMEPAYCAADRLWARQKEVTPK